MIISYVDGTNDGFYSSFECVSKDKIFVLLYKVIFLEK